MRKNEEKVNNKNVDKRDSGEIEREIKMVRKKIRSRNENRV